MGKPHILAIPYPAQGHVIPLMELALNLANHGIKVTFVNIECIHHRILKSLSETDNLQSMINMVSVPGGLGPNADINDFGKKVEAILAVMPGELEKLIQKINGFDEDKICCVVADLSMGWAMEVAHKMGIKRVAFSPAAVAMWGFIFNVRKYIEDGIIDKDGTILKDQIIQLSPTMPSLNSKHFAWNSFRDPLTSKIIFQLQIKTNEWVKVAERLIANSTNELEPGAFAFIPEMLPIGPLLASIRLGKSAGNFWQEDSSCLTWLNQQTTQSVIYIAFGSITIFDDIQFQELAMGLELTNMPFLWVVRPDTVNNTEIAYPKGFRERIKNRGLIVSWAPQQQVLSHPSVACFISHCGWNSTIEGLSNGVPFLCWPYFADQFMNLRYICDVWKIGIEFTPDEDGIARKCEIKGKVDQLLSDQCFKERALDLQGKVMSSVTNDGCSLKNLNNLIRWIKDKGEDSCLLED